MDPTLRMGDVVFVGRWTSVSRGNLVAFHYPLEPKVIFMKRVAGMPGDVVEIRDKRLALNGNFTNTSFWETIATSLPTRVTGDLFRRN